MFWWVVIKVFIYIYIYIYKMNEGASKALTTGDKFMPACLRCI